MLSAPSARRWLDVRLDLTVEAVSRDLRRRRRARDCTPLENALEAFVADMLDAQRRAWVRAVRPNDDFGRMSSVGTVDARWRAVSAATGPAFVRGIEAAYRASYAVGAGRMVKDLSEALTYIAPPASQDDIPLDGIGHAELQGTVFSVSDPQAVSAARLHAAELVTRIDSQTRAGLARIVTMGIRDGQSTDVIRRSLLASNAAFSRARAQMIAVTETAFAYERGRSAAAAELTSRGIRVEKAWLTEGGPRVCPTCEGNESDGWIGENASFGDGSDAPPAHPNCRCTTERRTVVDRTEQEPRRMSAVDPPEPAGPAPVNRGVAGIEGEGMAPGLRRDVKATFAELERDFPTAMNRLEPAIEPNMTTTRAYAETWGHGRMSFNPKYWSDETTLKSYINNDVAVGWHPVGTGSAKGITDHEFGHLLHFTYAGKVDRFLLRELPERMRAMGVRPTMKSKVNSKYGYKDVWGNKRVKARGYEWFAELFAEARSPLAYEELSAPGKVTRQWLAENEALWKKPIADVALDDRRIIRDPLTGALPER